MNVNKQTQESLMDTPLEQKESGSKMDLNTLASVIQQVMKTMEDKSSGSSNFTSIALHPYNKILNDIWIIDSGASYHMTGSKNLLRNIKRLAKVIKIGLPDGSTKLVNEVGELELLPNIILKDFFFFVTDFKHNLFSVGKIIEANQMSLFFDKNGCAMQDPITVKRIARGELEDGVYKLRRK